MSRRVLSFCLIFAVAVAVAPRARAYSVGTGFSEACHERITGRSLVALMEVLRENEIQEGGLEIPDNRILRALMQEIPHVLVEADEELTDLQRFLMVSALIGVRAPDTEGHSVTNLHHLRKLHGNPDARALYAHCTRGPDDDWAEGDEAALAGTIQEIRDQVAAAAALNTPGGDHIVHADVYLNFYGPQQVPVYGTSYHLGRALHAVQDSFSHTIRSDADDLKKIVTLMNYIDAIAGTLKEKRDGLAHSDSMDRCLREEAADLTAAAQAASEDFVLAVLAQLKGNEDALDGFFVEWMTLKPGCTMDDDYCGNTRWVKLARRDQTEPYLEEAFGCTAGPQGPARAWGLLLALVVCIAWLRMRRPT